MIINLNSVVEHYIHTAQEITKNTGESVQVIIKGITVAETYIDLDDYGQSRSFTNYNSKLNFGKN